MIRLLRSLITLATLSVLPFGASAATRLAVGQPAPDFALPNQDNKITTLADYHGKWLVLYFYPKDFTPGCTTEAQHFRDVVPDIQKLGASVVGISEDSVENHVKFIAKYHLNYTLLADDNGKVAAAYHSLYNLFGIMKFAKRHTFIIDPQGRIAAMYMDVNPARNPQEILTRLKELMPVGN
ncbi:peroxiredoxin [Acidihalobacter ferrooxydans]|uniref:thioredoxin-dependent peroxiredoxin n=1 Tax=Acidihalobacter ferrooxydans TaxID=1765967 RepID=A0A1P8UGC0_9GAMM|nr:peroxiredoxin [Acidihalobacter ferrooxydans]APZ42850.1 peroxiredoxin [Acidihalobacter ferrooxydans]